MKTEWETLEISLNFKYNVGIESEMCAHDIWIF